MRQALELDPGYSSAWNNLGIFHASQGHSAAEPGLFPRGSTPLTSSGRDVHWGRQNFAVSLELNPRDGRVWIYAGLCLWAGQDYAAAAQHFERAGQEDPRLAEAWMNLGRWHLHEKRLDQAQPLLERALQLETELAMAWYLLASTLLYQGRYQAAVGALDRYLEFDPASGDAWFNRGQALLQLKEPKAGGLPVGYTSTWVPTRMLCMRPSRLREDSPEDNLVLNLERVIEEGFEVRERRVADGYVDYSSYHPAGIFEIGRFWCDLAGAAERSGSGGASRIGAVFEP